MGHKRFGLLVHQDGSVSILYKLIIYLLSSHTFAPKLHAFYVA